jgi:hypothetical protein
MRALRQVEAHSVAALCAAALALFRRSSVRSKRTLTPLLDDPDDSKPADWVDAQRIPDPDASKPDDWDEDVSAAPPRMPRQY